MMKHSKLRLAWDQQLERLWKFFWIWAGRVPLRVKIIGITVIATAFIGLALVGWMSFRMPIQELSAHFVELVVVIGISMIVGLVVAYLLTNILTHPILEITRVTRLVDQGDLTQRAPVWANDEIGELGQSFNAMIQNLASFHEALNATNQSLRARNQELSALWEMADVLAKAHDIDSTLANGLTNILSEMDADAGCIAILDQAGNPSVSASTCLPEDLLGTPSVSNYVQESARQVVESGQPIYEPDLLSCGDLWPELDIFIHKHGLHSFSCLPLQAHDHIVGILSVFSAGSQAIEERMNSTTVALCNHLGTAIENMSLWEELKQREALRSRLLASVVSAQERERERISRELHDETSQALTALLVQLKVLEKLHSLEDVADQARELRVIVVETIDEVRRLAHDLRPSTLDNLGLISTVDEYVRQYQNNTNTPVNFQVKVYDETQFSHHLELVIYRVVQEALTNIARHAQASQVWISIEQEPHKIRLSVRDDGCGFDVDRVTNQRNQALGLLGIQERVTLIGGNFQLESQKGQGTSLQVDVAYE